jgi:hypothetical protein
MEYNNWTDEEKATHLLNLCGQAVDVLFSIPAVARYEEDIFALK